MLTESQPKDDTNETLISFEERKPQEAKGRSFNDVTKRVAEKDKGADLKVASQVAPTEVRLLKAVRLPGRHSKIVTSSAPKTKGMGGFMLEPTSNDFSDEGVRVTEALVGVNQDNHVKVVVENHSNYPVFLEEGTKLGLLEPVRVINQTEVPKALHLETDNLNEKHTETVARPVTKSEESQRWQQLLNQLEIEWVENSWIC